MGNEEISVKDLRSTPVVVGVDVRSTTVKAIVPDPDKLEILWSDDPRHNTKQPEKVHELLTAIDLGSAPKAIQNVPTSNPKREQERQ
jgi:hypothetical protein